MGRFQVRKIRAAGSEQSPEFDSPDAAQAFVQIEKDKDCTDAEIWENGKMVGSAHRRGNEASPFWLIDGNDVEPD